jgi:hypothetical protein
MPTAHETRDVNWFQVPDPQFMYMLTDQMTGLLQSERNRPKIENEWESGSFPVQWRPFWGEYVTNWGRHIFDMGHPPYKTEIHPGHTVVRQHTTVAPLGNGGQRVPANRAIIGMGLSGGFPGGPVAGNVDPRWDLEFGGRPAEIWGDTEACWPTNLKQHPLSFVMLPPVPRPSPTARLRWRTVLSEYIDCSGWKDVDDFLELCQYDDPAAGGKKRAFRDWDRGAGAPSGYTPKIAPSLLRPRFTPVEDPSGRHSSVEVTVNLGSAANIPVGYYAIVEFGWSEPGPHELRGYDVTFETIKAIETDEWWDDWHLYYGVNGQWAAWWTDNFIEEGKTYTRNTKFRVWTVDDLPIQIRDTGVEWDGGDAGNEKLDSVELTAAGPNHFQAIKSAPGVTFLSETADTLRFKALGTEAGDTKHEWTIKMERVP